MLWIWFETHMWRVCLCMLDYIDILVNLECAYASRYVMHVHGCLKLKLGEKQSEAIKCTSMEFNA